MKKKSSKFVKMLAIVGIMVILTLTLAVPCFAASSVDVGITTEMLEPILDYVTQNIAVIMPIGIAIMGIMIGIGLIPRIIKKYTNT